MAAVALHYDKQRHPPRSKSELVRLALQDLHDVLVATKETKSLESTAAALAIMTRLGYGDTNKEDRGKKALIKRLAAERAAGEETEQTETTRFDGSLNQAMENLNELQQEKEPNG